MEEARSRSCSIERIFTISLLGKSSSIFLVEEPICSSRPVSQPQSKGPRLMFMHMRQEGLSVCRTLTRSWRNIKNCGTMKSVSPAGIKSRDIGS